MGEPSLRSQLTALCASTVLMSCSNCSRCCSAPSGVWASPPAGCCIPPKWWAASCPASRPPSRPPPVGATLPPCPGCSVTFLPLTVSLSHSPHTRGSWSHSGSSRRPSPARRAAARVYTTGWAARAWRRRRGWRRGRAGEVVGVGVGSPGILGVACYTVQLTAQPGTEMTW